MVLCQDYCVEVGDTVDFLFTATDANNDILSLKATSGIFNLTPCPATLQRLIQFPDLHLQDSDGYHVMKL